MADPPPLRCAIYTRTSSDEGLLQDYNSLASQRDACAAYILSQKHEGWVRTKRSYDDGGFSGGNLDRPGLRMLLADLAVGEVNIVVIYKIDRLTRSLRDFAKLTVDGKSRVLSNRQIAVIAQVNKARKGDPRAFRELMVLDEGLQQEASRQVARVDLSPEERSILESHLAYVRNKSTEGNS